MSSGDPKLFLHRKLATTWSSAELASHLETKPSFLNDLLGVLKQLDQATKLRVLLAFLAVEDVGVLPKELVLAVLDEAAGDVDDWVKVVSSLVRDWVFGTSTSIAGGGGGGGGSGSSDGKPPYAEVTADVLSKCGLLLADEEARMDVDEETGEEGESGAGVSGRRRRVDPEPYVCPMEYLYLSEPLIQRHHRMAPLTRKENAHFVVGDLREVKMEEIPDLGAMPSSSSLAAAAAAATTVGASASSSSIPPSSRPTLADAGGVGSSSSFSKPERPHTHSQPTRPPPATAAASSLGGGGGGGGGSILSRAALAQQRQTADKPRLKLIKLDEVKKNSQAKIAASNEAVSQEFGLQPVHIPTHTQKEDKKGGRLVLRLPTPPAASASASAAAAAAGADTKKRSAAEALAGVSGEERYIHTYIHTYFIVPPPYPIHQPTPHSYTHTHTHTNPQLLQERTQAPAMPTPPSTAPPPTTTTTSSSSDALADYHRMKAKSNRLTPTDDERIRNFYMHGALGNPNPSETTVKIKINEEEIVKEDGSRVREILYITLNYESKKAVLSRKVSKPKV